MAYNKVDYGGKTLIDLTGDTVTPATLAKGETAHDMTGAQIVGTMEGGGGDEPPVYANYCAIYCAEDSSLTFIGTDLAMPQAGDTFKGMEITTVYTGVESTGTSNPPWYSSRASFTSVLIDASFAGCKPTSCCEWFYNFTNCTAIDGLKYLDTSSVTTMFNMFYSCSKITTLDVGNWDTSSVTTMHQMFYDCSGLTSLDVSSFNTSKVTNMSRMFRNCSKLTALDVSNWDISSVTTISYIFYGCSGLTSLDVSNFDPSSTTSFESMFENCSGLTTLDVSNWNTSNVTNMGWLFSGCSGLTTIYSDDSNFVTTAVTSGGSMFTSCSKLVGGNGTAYSSSNVTYTMAHIDTASNPGYFTDVNDKE